MRGGSSGGGASPQNSSPTRMRAPPAPAAPPTRQLQLRAAVYCSDRVGLELRLGALRLPLPLPLPLPPPLPPPLPLDPTPHQALAILLSCLASVPLFDFSPNHRFWGGAALVIVSIFLYAWAPKASPYVAVADAGGPK